MTSQTHPRLEPRSMIPPFHLPRIDGEEVNIWDYKARQNLVFAFVPAGECMECTDFLQQVSKAHDQYTEEVTKVFAIVRGSRDAAAAITEQIQPWFDVLYDQSGETTARYTDRLPAVFAADRFGEVYAEWLGFLPTQKDILDVVELINLECPECGARLEWK